jgi:hypothetical protein
MPEKIDGPFDTEEQLNESLLKKYIFNNGSKYKAEFYKQCLPSIFQDHLLWFWMGAPSSHGYYGEGTIEAMVATSSYIYHHGSENHIFVVSLSLLVRGLVVMVLESQ